MRVRVRVGVGVGAGTGVGARVSGARRGVKPLCADARLVECALQGLVGVEG